jgi:predicted nucleotide-binding protein
MADALRAALTKKLGLSESRVYALIAKRMQERTLSRRLAILSLALDNKVNTYRLANDEDFAALRAAGHGSSGVSQASPAAAPAPAAIPRSGRAAPAAQRARTSPGSGARPAKPVAVGDKVVVAYGRDNENKKAMFGLLRAMGLDPIEWDTAIAATGKPDATIRDIVDALFRLGKAAVIMFTPDDLVVLRPSIRKNKEPEHEREVTGQPRPNVIYEAGMAMALYPNRTVVVSIGPVKSLSDLSGLHVTGLGNGPKSRMQFETKLKNAGLSLPPDRSDWIEENPFTMRGDIEVTITEETDGDN